MTSKIKDSIKALESKLSSMCYPMETEEDDILIQSLSKLLPPNSSWSVFLDIREIVDKAKRALKSCPHSLRLLSYHNSNVSFVCHICNNNVLDNSSAEETEPDLEVEEIVSQVTQVRKDAESSPPSSSKEKTESDEEIDQLLMDTPEKENEEKSPTNMLKLRALSELLEDTEPLPTFSSRRLEDGTNPLQNIPLYEADLTLTDERSEGSPPASYSLRGLFSSARIRSPVLRPAVSSVQQPLVRTVAAVRVTRPPLVSLASSQISLLPAQSQLQSPVKTQQVRSSAPAQYLHYLPTSTSTATSSLNLSQPRPGGGKVRARVVSVPRPGGVQPQPFPQLSRMSSPAPSSTQFVQHRPPAPPQQVNLVQHRAPPGPQVNFVQRRPLLPSPPQQVHSVQHGPLAPPQGRLREVHHDHRGISPAQLQVKTVQQPLITDARLPRGWNRVINVLPDGSLSVTILDNEGRMFSNRQELQTYLYSFGNLRQINPNKIDFSVFGENL